MAQSRSQDVRESSVYAQKKKRRNFQVSSELFANAPRLKQLFLARRLTKIKNGRKFFTLWH
jgi:hypothetical protein